MVQSKLKPEGDPLVFKYADISPKRCEVRCILYLVKGMLDSLRLISALDYIVGTESNEVD